ncbi:MAG TPA: endonuclease NucS [Candidatus Ozemobacteraceae bacterium]|nr:endonuclease NucS [Candidatus Ozemobacteraceae bacterium]
MAEFRKFVTAEEVQSGTLAWSEENDADLRRVLPASLMFDLVFDGRKLEHLSAAWEQRELAVGELLTRIPPGSEIVLYPASDRGTTVICRTTAPGDAITVRKRLSMNEHKHRYLKWYAREDELYRRLFPSDEPFVIEAAGRRVAGHAPDFEKRQLVIGEALRLFQPGDNLLVSWKLGEDEKTLSITKEEIPSSVAKDAMMSLRLMVTRLISRPLNEFNEGDVKGLILLLDENKNLWERYSQVKEENEKLKEQIATIESVFEQFTRNTFFGCKRDFEEWVAGHMSLFEKGIRLIHRDYSVIVKDGRKRRIDLLCQDRKGVLVAVEVVFNPSIEDLEETLKLLEWLKGNIASFGNELTGGKLKATSIRGMLVTNREKPELVEQCLQNGIKLCVVTSGCVIDVIE